MGKIQRFPVYFSPAIREIIKQQEGILGNSESEIIQNIVLFYFRENGQLNLLKTNRKKKGELSG